MPDMHGHINVRQYVNGTQAPGSRHFYGPCTRDEATAWFEKEGYAIIYGEQATEGVIGDAFDNTVATFRTFSAEELEGETIEPLS